MPPEIWTASMHRPVDCRKLDALARKIVRCAVTYHTLFHSDQNHGTAHTDLLMAIGEYKKEVYEQILSEEPLE